MTPVQFRYIELCAPVGTDGACDTPSHLVGGICRKDISSKISAGKRPIHGDWARHWSLERPGGNAGVLAGPETGLLIIDVDTPEAAAVYASWRLPDTFTVASGRGGPGRHYYFRWPEGLLRVPNRLDDVELKGPGRQVVAWDSLHKSGGRYEKLGGQVADLPEAFVERVRGATAQRERSEGSEATPAALAQLEKVLEYFTDPAEQEDGNWLTLCPSHDDHTPSLLIKASGAKLIFHCRDECTAEDVLEAVGLPMSAMWAGGELVKKVAPTLTKVPLGTPTDLGTRAKLSDLMGASLGETRWVVPELLPDGLALLAGPPKLGKSWMVLDIAISVALGRPVLGREVEQGDVLYLALEDNWRRLQGRARTVLAGAPAPDRLELWTRAGTLTTGLVPEIETWISEQKTPRLVIIDTLGRVQEGSAWVDAKDGGYADAVSALSGLQEVAAARGVAVVVITHTKKGGWANGADPLEAVLGSQGYAGTADAVLVLKRERGEAGGELFVTGREIAEELSEAVWFDRESCRWLVGAAGYATLGDEVLDFLERTDKKGALENAWTLTGEGVAVAIHRRRSEVEAELKRLEAEGLVLSKPRPGRGGGTLWGPICLPQGLSHVPS